MESAELLGDLRDRGYTATVRDGRLKLRGPCRPPTDLERRIADCRDELIKTIEQVEHPLDCPCVDCSTTVPKYTNPIESAGEVLTMARAILNPEGIDYGPPPTPPVPKGRDPLTHHHTGKAKFFREVRERDLQRRHREGLPPWIRIVDGGAS